MTDLGIVRTLLALAIGAGIIGVALGIALVLGFLIGRITA